jgi:hypothetical protein
MSTLTNAKSEANRWKQQFNEENERLIKKKITKNLTIIDYIYGRSSK